MLPKLDATQTAWRRWVTYQYSFSEGGRFKTICAMLSLKMNSVPYQFLVVSNKSTVLKTMPWILFLLQWLILKEIIAIFNKLKRLIAQYQTIPTDFDLDTFFHSNLKLLLICIVLSLSLITFASKRLMEVREYGSFIAW